MKNDSKIPTIDHKKIIIDSAEESAREVRREVMGLRDDLRRDPENDIIRKDLIISLELLEFYEEDAKLMRGRYGAAK